MNQVKEAHWLAKKLFNFGGTVPAHKLILKNMVQYMLPNVMTALRMYKCLMITNAAGERTLSLPLLHYGQ